MIIKVRNRIPNLRKTGERGRILSVSSAGLLRPRFGAKVRLRLALLLAFREFPSPTAVMASKQRDYDQEKGKTL